MALQLTFYQGAGHFVLTLRGVDDSVSTWPDATETVRTLTCEAAEFVRAMVDDNVAVATKVALLRRAAAVHQRLYKDSMNGMGIDRHLFGLYVVAKGLGYDSSFLGKVLSRPWTMSTSQQPQTQITTSPDPNLPFFKDKMCPGGGFGPVADDGYGVSYMVPNDAKIFFHVSSRRSCVNTDSARFQDRLFATLSDMKALFEEPQ
ncbi:PREDICTED: carnitine O-palmitoyltransferase 1, liver isoform-like [Priapulus caudatus]|uniref:Carnitine O-palmitoyltransferase 1, liver isoform-like n=1 Tax=Priapulus caudatus TaxID=37621 RepID=A0ABM1DYG1_PRICU|nr:PREDICTED: carnitine O-palmitoyltransferase 1, liver isoform-like [Priapulus caudatus]